MADGILGGLRAVGEGLTSFTTGVPLPIVRQELGEARLRTQQQEATVARQQRSQELLRQIQGGQPVSAAQPQPGVQAAPQPGGLVVTPIAPPEVTGAPTVSRTQALAQFAVEFPEQFEQLNQNLGLITQGRKDEAADFAFKLRNTPFNQREPLIQQRIAAVESDPTRSARDTRELSGQTEEEQNQSLDTVQIAALSPKERLKIARGEPVSAKEQAETAKLLAETDKIRAEQGESRIKDKERAETEKLRAQTDEIRQKISQGVGISATDTKVLEEERKATVKANVKRIADLGQSSSSRAQAASKARRFLKLFQDGKVESGTTRRVAGFLPGVFTEQAAFDQELEAFAEVAAREKLKAVGEIRPTDADVEGMKRALFGVNRDEATNIQLLSEFILEQEALDNELEDLRTAKRAGQLDVFTGGPLAPTGEQPPEPAAAPTQPAATGQQLSEGDIITNPQTGQRLQVVNGQLVDAPLVEAP